MTSRNAAYTGEVEMVFDGDGRLVLFDVMATNMPPTIIRIFKEKVPVHIDELPTAFRDTVTIVEASYEVDFIKDFWNKYEKKINKQRCLPVWEKLSLADRVAACLGIKPYDKYLKGLPYKRPKADPETYLKDRYWENEWK